MWVLVPSGVSSPEPSFAVSHEAAHPILSTPLELQVGGSNWAGVVELVAEHVTEMSSHTS